MEMRIEYTKTVDGVKIATAALGTGPPLVLTPNFPWSHIRLEWTLLPEAREWYEALASRRRLILYDGRGGGLSDRDVSDFTLPRQIYDLEAVADHWKLGEFALIGMGDSGTASIDFAATHQERVTELVLWCASSSPRQQEGEAELDATMSMLKAVDDWDYFAKMAANVALLSSSVDLRQRFTEWARNATSREVLLAAWQEQLRQDVTHLLPRIVAPTLVVHRAQVAAMSIRVPEEIASLIPNAKLELLEGSSWLPWGGDTEAAVNAIYRFLGETRVVHAQRAAGSVRTVLFSDLVGHTEMMQRLGDEAGRNVLREHERITREVLKTNGGTEVKTMGDGFLASFGSVTKAVECAVALQKTVEEWNHGVGAHHDAPLQVRCGLNAGEPIEEDGDLFGSTVILASRIAAKADAGEILVANTVRELCSGKGFLFADRGEFVAKGFEEPVRVYEVRWQE